MENIKFNEGGRWAGHPSEPILEVEAGKIYSVSDYLAKVVVDAGKGERVPDALEESVQKQPKAGKKGRSKGKKNPSTEDKHCAESD